MARDRDDDHCVPYWLMLLWGFINWLVSGYVYARTHGIDFWN